jgi:branched-chain amino acid transport system substrate-binding protein
VFRGKLRVAIGAALVSMAGLVGISGASGAAARTSAAPITIGVITSLTGAVSGDVPASQALAGLTARVDYQNAHGGVNGHQIELKVVDDQSTATGNQLAAQVLVDNDHVLAVIEASALVYGGARFLQENGVPVVGFGVDGPEWGEQPYSNMFTTETLISTPFNGIYYTYTTLGVFFKSIGITKLAGVGYSIPAGVQAQKAMFDAAAKVGIKNCYDNSTIVLGAVNFTANALAIKEAGCNGVVGTTTVQSTVALSEAVKQAGIKAKQFFYEGYSQASLDQPQAMKEYDGAYFESSFPAQNPDSGTKTMIAALKKYGGYKSGLLVDDAGLYVLGDLMIKGLEVAGKNPTRQAFIANLRKVGNYTAGGVLPSPVTFQHFGTVGMLPKVSCQTFAQAQGDAFVPVDGGKPVCGKLIPIT